MKAGNISWAWLGTTGLSAAQSVQNLMGQLSAASQTASLSLLGNWRFGWFVLIIFGIFSFSHSRNKLEDWLTPPPKKQTTTRTSGMEKNTHTHKNNNNNQWVAETVTVSRVNQCKQIPKPTANQSISTDKKKACGLRAGSHQLQLFSHDSLQNKSFYTLKSSRMQTVSMHIIEKCVNNNKQTR